MRTRRSVLILGVLWLAAALYLLPFIHRGWVPHDEGTIGQSAERVLGGELPHRDFDDPYTGALSFLNAAAYRALGVGVAAPRIVLVVFFLLSLPAFFYAATRFCGPLTAGAVTAVAVLWSLPNYLAALPSWYNLICAVVATAALLRYVEQPAARWLFLAGLLGGVSFLMKLSGVFLIAGGLLFLLFREQEDARREAIGGASQTISGYTAVIVVALVAVIVALFAAISNAGRLSFIVQFALPIAAVAGLLIVRELRYVGGAGASARRTRRLAGLVVPFLAGVATPIALFLIPYVFSGSLGDIVHGVLIAPSARLSQASVETSGWMGGLVGAGVLLALLDGARRLERRAQWLLALAVLAIGGLLLILSKTYYNPYRVLWRPVALLIPVAAVVTAARLAFGARDWSSVDRQRVMIVLGICVACSLVQFPFAAPIYFCYVAPLLALLLLGVESRSVPRLQPVAASLLVIAAAFAVSRVNHQSLYGLGYAYFPDRQTERLSLDRADGLRVFPSEQALYETVIATIRAKAAGTQYVYAAPDAPEVSFLAGLRNPTRTQYDIFDDPARHDRGVLDGLDRHDVRVIALNLKPAFSSAIDGPLRAELMRRYPFGVTIGRFEVRWRE